MTPTSTTLLLLIVKTCTLVLLDIRIMELTVRRALLPQVATLRPVLQAPRTFVLLGTQALVLLTDVASLELKPRTGVAVFSVQVREGVHFRVEAVALPQFALLIAGAQLTQLPTLAAMVQQQLRAEAAVMTLCLRVQQLLTAVLARVVEATVVISLTVLLAALPTSTPTEPILGRVLPTTLALVVAT
jgi:hypothetical protein